MGNALFGRGSDKHVGSKESGLEIVVLGTGAGATHIYSKESSSSFVVLRDGEPVLLCDMVGSHSPW